MLSLSEEREVELREMTAEYEASGVDMAKHVEVRLPRSEWLQLAELITAIANIEVRFEACEDAEAMSTIVDPNCGCFACDMFDAIISGRLADLMRLNLFLADAIPADASPELFTAYEDFWPAIAIECNDYC